MPPHSFAEWVIGQNLPRRIRKPNNPPPNSSEVQQYKLELFTDDELQVEKVALTYPRAVRFERDEAAAEPDNPAAKKVSFSSPPKPAIKKPSAVSPPETPTDTPVAAEKDGEASSAPEGNDSSDGHGRGRRRRRNRRRIGRSRSSRSLSSGHDTDDSEPCRCPKCKARQIKLGLRYRERRLSQKLRELRQLGHGGSSDEDETSDDELPRPRYTRRKHRVSPVTDSSEEVPHIEESESETSYESYVSTDTDSPGNRRRSRRTHRHYFRKHQSKNGTSRGEEGKEKAAEISEAKDEVKASEAKVPEAKNAEAEPAKTQENTKVPAVQPAPFKAETIPRPDFVRPNLLLPVKAQVLKVEHAVEAPEDPRPNSFYDVDTGTIRVYHGPVYGNPTGTMYPIRHRNRVASLPVGVPHPMANPHYEASPFGLPCSYNPAMPYWPGQPLPPHPGLPGFAPLPYYNPMGLEARTRTVSSDSNEKMEANTSHEFQNRTPRRGKKSPPKIMEEPGRYRDNNYYGSPPDRRQKRHRSSHGKRARETECNEGLDSNNNAANLFDNDDNNGEGWGRSAWDDPPSVDQNDEEGGRNKTSAEPWGSAPGANQADHGGDNWGGPDKKKDEWGTGSADNNNNNNNGETDYWANAGADEAVSQRNWCNDNSGGQNRDRPNSADDNGSWRRSSSGFTGLPSDSNVIPPMAYSRKPINKNRNSGEAGNWGWVDEPPNPSQGMAHAMISSQNNGRPPTRDRDGKRNGPTNNEPEPRSMPGAWEVPVSYTQEPAGDNRERQSRVRRNKNRATNDDFVPSWGDPTAAQSSHDPPAFRGDNDKIGRDAPVADQW